MPWTPTPAEPVELPALLRECSALLGSAYTTSDLARDLAALGHPVKPRTVHAWLSTGRIPAEVVPVLERLRLYVRTVGYLPSACCVSAALLLPRKMIEVRDREEGGAGLG